MAGKVAIVTGSNCGIGFEAAEILCGEGADVVLACRSEERGTDAVKRIKDIHPSAKATFSKLDLSDFSSIKDFAHNFLALNKPLHILILNAGVAKPYGVRETTVDGLELHFGTNHVGHFLLTSLLLDKLKQTGTQQHKARIVAVASTAHNKTVFSTRDVDWSDLQLEKPGAYNGGHAYKISKLSNIMMTQKLSRILANDNVIINSMCPGLITSTEIFRHITGFRKWLINFGTCICYPCVVHPFIRTTNHGGRLITFLATDPSVEGTSGCYFQDFKCSEPSSEANDVEKQELFWRKTKDLILERIPGIHTSALFRANV